MRARGRFFVLALTVFALGLAPASAFHANQLPVIESFSSFERGWVSYSIRTDGSQAALDIETDDAGGAFQMGVAEFTEEGRFISANRLTGFPSKDGTMVEARVGPVEHHQDTMNRDSSTNRAALGGRVNGPARPPHVGVRKVLAWWAGDATQWRFTLRGGAGIEILGKETGTSAFFYRSHDFRSTAQVQAWGHQRVEPYNVGYGARAQAGGALTLEVEDALFLTAVADVLAPGVLTISAPDGERLCTLEELGVPPAPDGAPISPKSCDMVQMTDADRAGPGTYVVKVSGVGLADYFYGEVHVAGVDARLPG